MGGRLSYPVADLSGKVAMVTGGNTGIGYEISKALAEMGAHTFIACKLQEGEAPAVEVSMAAYVRGVLNIAERQDATPTRQLKISHYYTYHRGGVAALPPSTPQVRYPVG